MPTGSAHVHRLNVRFRDCDLMGHVNHTVFLTYAEEGRSAFWRQLTGSPRPPARDIIARAECDYRAPAFFGDEIEVRLRVGDIGRSSFNFVYEIVNAHTGQRLAEVKTVMVVFDYEAGKPTPIPREMRTLLESARSET